MFQDISWERKNMKSFKQRVNMKTTHTAFLFVYVLRMHTQQTFPSA